MKTGTKIIIGVTAIIGLIAYYGWQKAIKLKKQYEQIEIKLSGIRNFSLSWDTLKFDADIKLINTSTEAFSVNGYIATLKRFNFFYNGKYFATAKIALSQIEIPAQNELIIKNVAVVSSVKEVLDLIPLVTSFDQNKLAIEAVIEVAGNEIYIK